MRAKSPPVQPSAPHSALRTQPSALLLMYRSRQRLLAFIAGYHFSQHRRVLAGLARAPHNALLHVGPGVLSALPGELDADVLLRVPEHIHGLSTRLHQRQLLSEHATVENDPLVRFAQLLLRAIGDRALGDPGHDVL